MNSPHLDFCFIFFTLFPTTFFRFQEHHDGYVLATSKFMDEAFRGNFQYPFSQYGPLWSIILGILNSVSPDKYLLLSIRFFSVLCVAISVGILSQLSKKIFHRKLSFKFSFVIVITWYLFGPYYGWPSIFLLPIVSLIIVKFIKIIYKDGKSNINIFTIGILISLVQFLRIQVGISLLIFSIIFCVFLKTKGLLIRFITGYLFGNSLMLLYLEFIGALKPAIFDQFLFAFKFHLSSERGALRVPVWTLLILSITFFLTVNLQKMTYVLSLKNFEVIALIVLLTLVAIYILEIIYPNDSLSYFHWRVTQRVFVGVVLGMVVFNFYVSCRNLIKNRKSSNGSRLQLIQIQFLLAGVAMAVATQTYPLFASHHVWYSLIPVLFSAYAQRVQKLELANFNHFVKYWKFIGLASLIYLLAWNIDNISFSVKSPTKHIVYIEKSEADSLNEFRDFLDEQVPISAKVHNFCPDPTLYLVRDDLVPASRLIVWWNHFDQFSEYSVLAKQPADFAVVCAENLDSFKKVNSGNWYFDSMYSGSRLEYLYRYSN